VAASPVHGSSGSGCLERIDRQSARIAELEAERDAVRESMALTGRMLSIYGEDCFPPPNEKGQRHFGDVLIDSAAKACIAVAYPLHELCQHEIDEQAGCCRKCGAYTEAISPLR
jgi:hypothetical protein